MDTLSEKPIMNLQPSYTDQCFAKAQTVWIADGRRLNNGIVSGASYNYSDHICQWDHTKATAVADNIDLSLDRRSPAYIQAFLRKFFSNDAIELVHVMAGIDVSSGYPYQVYGYIE